jgi:hypothetical protein
MFGWFKKDPVQALERRYKAKLAEAKDAGEKYGDRAKQAELYAEAEALLAELEALEAQQAS